MGYDLHITRAEEWSDNATAQIELEEWVSVANADPGLEAEPANGEGFFVARGLREDEDDGWFDWFAGNVDTKNPDRPTLAKMLALARALDARVQGDDGEIYQSPDDL